MKKHLTGLFFMLVMCTISFAQKGEEDLKNASKLLAKYNKDPFANAQSLNDAIALLNLAFNDELVKKNPMSWVTKGDIFKSLASSDLNNKLIKPDFKISDYSSAIKAVEAYMSADKLAATTDSKTAAKITSAIIKGLIEIEGSLNDLGIAQYQAEDYVGAMNNFNTELNVYDYLKKNAQKSRLNEAELLSEKQYFTAVAATYTENYDVAIPLLEKVIAGNSKEVAVYQMLYQAYEAKGMNDKAFEALTIGRSKFPDDSNLLFTEINYYLKKGELQKMIGNLETALAKEPSNISVVTTLGQVYDQLSVSSDASGDAEKTKEYFDKAATYYTTALAGNADNFDLNYSMGALYYNRAAGYTDDLNALSNDFSAGGLKKYDALKKSMFDLFESALPYFLKADALNGKDKNTLIALKEIMARKSEFAKSEEYKKRLESLE